MKKFALFTCLLAFLFSTARGQNLEPAATQHTPPPKETSELIFKRQANIPLFPGCEAIRDKAEQRKCTEEKLHQFFVANLQYPKTAERREGTVIVQFSVEMDGSISGKKVIRDIGGGCGEEVLQVVGRMPYWSPGSSVGRQYRITYRVPVRFEVE